MILIIIINMCTVLYITSFRSFKDWRFKCDQHGHPSYKWGYPGKWWQYDDDNVNQYDDDDAMMATIRSHDDDQCWTVEAESKDFFAGGGEYHRGAQLLVWKGSLRIFLRRRNRLQRNPHFDQIWLPVTVFDIQKLSDGGHVWLCTIIRP